MPSVRIHHDFKDRMYFLTFTVKNWYYIFDRHNRFEILANSLIYCQKNKGLRIFAYVFMLNHLHLVATAQDLIACVRDFKKFTSKEIQKNLLALEPNAWKLFVNQDGSFKLWEEGNMPKSIESEKFLNQKIEYIHFNPVSKQYVTRPEYWYWSSANPESPIQIEPLMG